jgi:hypothetical protein
MKIRRGVREMIKHINKIGIFIFIIVIIVQFGKLAPEAKKRQEANDLMTIAARIQGEKIEVSEWSIHAREKLTYMHDQNDAENFIRNLRVKFPKWEWTVTKKELQWEATAVSPDHTPFQEKIKFVATSTNQSIQGYLIYEVNGQAWAGQTERFLTKDLPLRISNIFRVKPTIFSCIKAEIDGKMVSSLSETTTELLKAFEAKEIESITENSFVSVTAASPFFSESLKRERESMNLQFALRTEGMGAKTTLVVGTPIITIEY